MQYNRKKMRNSPNNADALKPANRKYEIVYLVCSDAYAHMLTYEMKNHWLDVKGRLWGNIGQCSR